MFVAKKVLIHIKLMIGNISFRAIDFEHADNEHIYFEQTCNINAYGYFATVKSALTPHLCKLVTTSRFEHTVR